MENCIQFYSRPISTISPCQMIDTVTGSGPAPFAVQLKALLDREARYQPKLSGLRLMEGASARLREFEVKDLLSLTRFFGFCSETFSLAVSLLDRFLSVMKVKDTQPPPLRYLRSGQL